MASFSLYVPADNDLAQVKIVRDGGYLALLVPPIYLAVHRLWFALAVYLGGVLAILLAGAFIGQAPALFLTGLASLYVWLEGGELRRRTLERSGWVEFGPVNASGRAEAELRLVALAERQMKESMFGKPVADAIEPGPVAA